MKKKKVLFHINSLGKGGAERVVSVLAKCFAKDDYDVTIITLWRADEEYELADKIKRINIEDAWLGKRMGRIQKAVRRLSDLRKNLQEEKPDIVISFCNKANFRSAYAMIGMKIPLLISVRNDPRKDYLPYPFFVKRMEKKAAGCVFQTTDARACFSEAFQKKSKVIWNPVDEKYLMCTGNSENVGRRNRDIVAVGRFSVQKNHLLLLKAYNRIRERFPETTLKLFGEDNGQGIKDTLLTYVKEQGMYDCVKFMGLSSQLEKDIRNAGLFVLSSDYEGMPNVLIEAMVMGVPVISTDCPCGGPKQLIEDGISGLLVPVGDEKKLATAMAKLLEDEILADTLGKNATNLVEKVSPQKVYEEWKKYVNDLIG